MLGTTISSNLRRRNMSTFDIEGPDSDPDSVEAEGLLTRGVRKKDAPVRQGCPFSDRSVLLRIGGAALILIPLLVWLLFGVLYGPHSQD